MAKTRKKLTEKQLILLASLAEGPKTKVELEAATGRPVGAGGALWTALGRSEGSGDADGPWLRYLL